MKYKHRIVIKLCIIIMFVLCAVAIAQAETFYLYPVEKKNKEDKIKEYEPQELLEIEKGKNFIINFLKISFDEKWKLTTKKYKEIYKSVESLKRAFDKESYSQIDFIKITLHNKKPLSMTIKTNLYWDFEGYEGVMTYYFLLEKENNKWLLDWLVF